MDNIQEFLISKIFPKQYRYYQNIENSYLEMLDVKKLESNRLKDKVHEILNMNCAILKIVERKPETLLIYVDYRLDGKSIYMDNIYGSRIATLHFEIQEEYLDNEYSSYRICKKIHIVDFIVSGKNRGRGYGSEVMAALICLAKNINCTEISGSISPTDYKEFMDENNSLKKYPNDFYRKHSFDVSEKTGKITLNLNNK